MIYLDNSATSLYRPDCVTNAVIGAMCTMGNPGRGIHSATLSASRCVYSARKALASLFNAESASTIAFASNATEALNTAILGAFNTGEHIISTVSEHNSVLRPLYLLEQAGVEVDYIKINENGVLLYDTVESLIKPNTRAFVLMHASNVTGNVTQLDFFAELKQRYGISLVVDGAQTAGIIPVDVQKEDIDIYCFTGHKGLLGPQGTGGLYLSPKSSLKIRPLKVGGSGVHSFDKLHPSAMPEALEAGTLNCHGIAGLKASAEYIANIGVEKLRENEFELATLLCNGLKAIKGVKLYGDYSGACGRVPIVSFNIDGMDSGLVSDMLFTDYDIASRSGAHCAPMVHIALGTKEQGIVRLSLGLDTTRDDVEKTIKAVRELAEQ